MGQTLTTTILINAKAGGGFAEVGNTLLTLGSMVNGVSDKLIAFGKDSVNVYREYEKSMTDAEVALSTTYGRGTQELKRTMSQLDEAATEWAATTIFHTNDVGNAISEAAHAGWDLDQIMVGLPAAMNMARAGSMDLSEAVDYVVKSTNAAGVGFDDMGDFLDMWVYAANSSASTVEEFGDAMLRMGSTMQFSGSTAELMTLIAVMANAGTAGADAGTMVRNSMLRLAAPTKKAKETMEAMGASSEEVKSIMGDVATAEANAALAAQGFSVYYTSGQNKGQLRNMVDIYKDMYVALGAIAGGYDKIDKNEQTIGILQALFGQRSITGALNLLKAAANDYAGLYDSLMNGDSAGYAQYASDTMMNTLDGRIETYESKVERLKQLVGKELEPQVSAVTGMLGDWADAISNLDDGKFSALISGVEVIALAGPSLMTAGMAFRFIGYALTPLGGAALGLMALAAAATSLNKLNESKFADNFGSMDFDTEGVLNHVKEISSGFSEAYQEVNSFRTALDESVKSYQSASSEFSSDLLEKMLTNTKLTEADKKSLQSLGNDMYMAVQESIANSAAASMSYWNVLFGGDGTAEYDPAYQQIIEKTSSAYEEAKTQVSKINMDMRAAMTSAFKDGEISEEEYNNILSYMRSYNEAIARAAAEAKAESQRIEIEKLLLKGQTASLDSIRELSDGITERYDQILSDKEDNFLTEYVRAKLDGVDAETLARTQALYQDEVNAVNAQRMQSQYKLWDTAIRNSDMGQYYSLVEGLAHQYLENGMDYDTVSQMLIEQMGASVYAGDYLGKGDTARTQMGRTFGEFVEYMGGQETIESLIAYYDKIGNTSGADMLRTMYTMEEILNGFGNIDVRDTINGDNTFISSNDSRRNGAKQQRQGAADAALMPENYTIESAKNIIDYFGSEEGSIRAYFDAIGQSVISKSSDGLYDARPSGSNNYALYQMTESLRALYDLPQILRDSSNYVDGMYNAEDFAVWDLMFGEASKHAEDYRITAPIVPEELDVSGLQNITPVPVPISPHIEGEDSMLALQDQGVTVDVGADATELTATIDGADGQTLIEYLKGDAEGLHLSIMGENGQVLTEIVNGNVDQLRAAINQFRGQVITVGITGKKLFATGGRATEASTFGEAGPEWAIPEQHTERTAELLNAARAASGFTWGEILGRFGGLNANPVNQQTTIVYSPVIHANDAAGVEAVLRADKERLDKWFEEKKMRDSVEVYS